MNIHEYQAKIILREYGVPIPDFVILDDCKKVDKAIDTLGVDQAVVKVQVHAGGRGKAGGVKLARSRDEIRKQVNNLLKMKIVNNQTGKEGVIAHQVMVTPLTDYLKEYYIGAIIDRSRARAVIIASPEGGIDIEMIAAQFPEKIATIPIRFDGKLRSYDILYLLDFMGWNGPLAEDGKKLLCALARAFVEKDASLLEINPLVQTTDGHLLALDAKLSVDDNALYRQPQIAGFYDSTQVPQNEVQAKNFDLAYVALDGEIGCMVNGAGLAMATMDIIHHYGGKPANFLDVGGGATQDKVAGGFKIILDDPQVKAILVNIFGGIMNCVTLAGGIIAASGELGVKVPLVVRMEGTNVEQGRKMLEDSGLHIIIANDLGEAAQKVVSAAKGGK